jgi:hypothetical protein
VIFGDKLRCSYTVVIEKLQILNYWDAYNKVSITNIAIYTSEASRIFIYSGNAM